MTELLDMAKKAQEAMAKNPLAVEFIEFERQRQERMTQEQTAKKDEPIKKRDPDIILPAFDRFDEQLRKSDGQISDGVNGAELLDMVFPEPRWAVPDLLMEGVNILAGKPKKGKSIMALGIGLNIALGGLALQKIPVQEGDVIYLALEDTLRRIQTRMKQMLGYSTARPRRLHLHTKWPRMNVGGLDLLEKEIRKVGDVRLVIIDTLQKFRPPTKSGNSANIYERDYEPISAIRELAEKMQLCILIVTHQRKMDAEDIFDTVSGSTGLTGAADAVLILETIRGDATLHVTGKDIESTEYAVSLDIPTFSWTMLGDKSEIQKSRDKQMVYDAVKASNSSMSPSEISGITGVKLWAVKRILAGFLDEGKIRKVEYGRYLIR